MRHTWIAIGCALGVSGLTGVAASSGDKAAKPAAAVKQTANDQTPSDPSHLIDLGVWEPADGLKQIALWPEGLSIERPETDNPETTVKGTKLVGGRTWAAVMNVSKPTMTIYPPKGKNTGATIMVLPGGGYEVVAIDLEGTEICDWVTSAGMTCVLLKYRVPQYWNTEDRTRERPPKVPVALQDAQRAMGLVRQRATTLHIDPHKIGVIGFSAGGHLVSAISNADVRAYTPVDAADREPSRPDFAIALYPGHLWPQRGGIAKGVELYPWNTISKQAPPTFLLHSMDDPVDDVRNSIAYALALREAKVSLEMHIYPEGGHAFGLRPTRFAISKWPTLVETWLHTIKVL